MLKYVFCIVHRARTDKQVDKKQQIINNTLWPSLPIASN